MTASTVCPDCGTGLVERDLFCSGCGKGVVRCTNCGGVGMAGDKYCAHCGYDLPTDDETPVPAFKVTASRPPISPWEGILQRLKAATVGEYEVVRELGRGGMAAVFLARDLALNRSVAIKVMSPGVMLSDGMIDRFHQEAVTVANLNHSNIITVHAVRELDDLHFFVMEFVAGRALDRVLADVGALPIPVVRAIVSQVGSALAYAHRRGVIHRDVKPGNIILDSDGEAIVTDFGIAKVMTSTSQTVTGAVHGTAAYMSPEQCYAGALTSASDQYSLGVVAFEMLAGKPPFSGDSAFALMQAHTTLEPPPLTSYRPDCPPDLEAAVLRMLAKKPNDRWPNMNAALNGLRAFPVAPEDPVLDELLRLANAGIGAGDSDIRTPISPIPSVPRRTPSRAATPSKGATPAPNAGAAISAGLAAPDAAVSAPADAVVDPVDTKPIAPIAITPLVAAVTPPPVAPPAHTDTAGRTTERVAPIGERETATRSQFPTKLVLAGVGLVALLGVGIVVFGGTGDDPPPKPDTPSIRVPRIVTMSEPPQVVRVGDTFAFSADVRGGDSLAASPAQWESLTPAARVDGSSGQVSALSQGQAIIVVTSGEAKDTAVFDVVSGIVRGPDPVRVASIEIQVPAGGTTLEVGARMTPRVLAFDSSRAPAQAGTVTWSSGDPRIATVNARTGEVTAVAGGSVRITARSDSHRADATIVVQPPVVRDVVISGPDQLESGQSSQLTATARDARNHEVAGATVSWSSANRAVVQVDPSTGRVRAGDAGQVVITATAGSVTATKLMVVTKKPDVVVTNDPPPPPPPRAKEPSAEELMRSGEARIKTAVEGYARELGARNLARVAAVYNPVTEQDRKNLDALSDLMRSNSLTLVRSAVGEPRLESRRVLVNLSATLKWRSFAGANIERQVPFLAEFELNGSEWRLVSCRVVGSPKLS